VAGAGPKHEPTLALPSDAATRPQIRRRYRNLITKEHPDKGGDADRFAAIQRAYDVLSNAAKRAQYDETGVAERSADEELMDAFGGGAFLGRQG
jgi:trans-2-enoyl-CoA reductase